jgi:phosphoribosylamine--glycine ligase
MKILVVGGGGREHAIAWKLSTEPGVETVFVAPGNAGTGRTFAVENVCISEDEIPSFVEEKGVDLVVVGPEAPLVRGLGDRLRERGKAVIGPNADGALLEGSKTFCKEVLVAAGVPTAAYAVVQTEAEVHGFVDAFDGRSLVVKADGLAGGKGVVVCDDPESARSAAIEMLRDRPFGDASATVVLEERLYGVETSYIVLTDGTRFVPLPTSQDHKRLLVGDRGPNTGGMGAYSPVPFVSAAMARAIEDEVILPTLAELRRRKIDYRGFLYAGIMLTDRGPMVLEFNVRLGDPETQALMMALGGGLLDALRGAAAGRLEAKPFIGMTSAATVVLAAAGYPFAPVKGARIDGLEAECEPGVVVFHAGTEADADGTVVAGGRVLGVTASGTVPREAVNRAYRAIEQISWPGMQFRTDIGKALLED